MFFSVCILDRLQRTNADHLVYQRFGYTGRKNILKTTRKFESEVCLSFRKPSNILKNFLTAGYYF